MLKASALRWSAGLLAVAGTVWNFWYLNAGLQGPGPRQSNDIVVFEDRFQEIKSWLWREGYRSGDLAYATARSFKGQPPKEKDGVHWAELRYVTIPFNLVQDLPNATYVLGDFTGGDPIPETPAGLVKLFDPGNGLVLYRRASSP